MISTMKHVLVNMLVNMYYNEADAHINWVPKALVDGGGAGPPKD